MNYDFDDDDEELFNVYENAQWYWDEKTDQLMFKSDVPEVQEDIPATTGVIGPVEFRQDIDLNEQQRFRKRFQRKYTSTDVVTLQDVKDVVLFTAPQRLLSSAIINILHLHASERLMRALILYCQYYLQISDTMNARKKELEEKIRTEESDKTEETYRENLEDLRLLVGKEYAALITGSGEFSKYHHMGVSKKMPSLLKKERMLFEIFLRINIQIIWIALGRKSFVQIELEVHRIFKSHIFNIAQHKVEQQTEYLSETSSRERIILTGTCILTKKKVNTRSPLVDEMNCMRDMDYGMFGLGVVAYPRNSMSTRLRFLEAALILPESAFEANKISMGILGALRNRFDIMLNEIIIQQSTTTSSPSVQRKPSSRQSGQKTKSVTCRVLYRNIYLPQKERMDLITEFPTESIERVPINKVQKKIESHSRQIWK